MNFIIRPYEPEDYQQLLDISYAVDLNGLGFSLISKLKTRKLVSSQIAQAADAKTIVGYALLDSLSAGNQKVRLELTVHPDYEQSEAARLLYTRIEQDLAEVNPTIVQVRITETQWNALWFYLQRGFVENHRMMHASLTLADFDSSRYSGLVDQLRQEDIYITTLVEEIQTNPNALHNLHGLDNATSPDYPRDPFETFTPRTFEQSAILHENPKTLYIAKCDEQYIGYSHFRKLTDEVLQQGFTAVHTSYSSKGVATALKVHILLYGITNGFHHIKTSYRNNNIAMRTINEVKLGYVPYSSEIRLEKWL